MKVAICDDDPNDIRIIKEFSEIHKNVSEIVEFTSPKPFLKRLYSGEHFDLLFLDVQMPELSGWKIAKEIKASKAEVFIAMVTIMGEYIYECFDRVDWFVEKPMTKEKVHKIIDKSYEKLYPTILSYKTNKLTVELTAPEIIYFEIIHNYLFVSTINNTYKVRLTLYKLEKMVSGLGCFTRIHQSYIINLSYLDKIDGNDVVMKNGVRLPISRRYKKALYNTLADYLRRN